MLIYFPIQIKTGAPCRSERLAKYNQVRIAFVTAVAILFIIFQFKSGQLNWYVLVTTIGIFSSQICSLSTILCYNILGHKFIFPHDAQSVYNLLGF